MKRKATHLTQREIETILTIREVINDIVFLGDRPNWKGKDLLQAFLGGLLVAIPCYLFLVLAIGMVPLNR